MLLASCTLGEYDGPLPRAGDVALDPVIAPSQDVLHGLLGASLDPVIAELAAATQDIAEVIAEIEGAREDARDGRARVFGPFEDPDGRAPTWTVAVTPGERSTRFSLSTASLSTLGGAQDERVADAAVTTLRSGRRGVWTVWPGRYGARVGTPATSPNDRAIALSFTAPSEGPRTLTVQTDRDAGGDDALAAVYGAGIEFVAFEDGSGSLRMRSAVPVPEGVLAGASAEAPSFAVAWTDVGAHRIRVRGTVGDVEFFVDACYDGGGTPVFRAVEPPALAEPQFPLGDGSACTIPATTVPVPQ